MQEVKIKSIKKLNIKNDRYDLTMFKNHNFFANGILIHNTSARSSYAKAVYKVNKFQYYVNKIFHNFFKNEKWEYVSGSRRVVLDNERFKDSNKLGYYNDNDFRLKYHDAFKDILHKGETIYYEIIGWVGQNNSIMPTCDNRKTKDPEFIKKYGDVTTFKYGCVNGTNDIYVYRISLSNEDGYEVDYSWDTVKQRCKELLVKHVPELTTKFIYDGDKDKLIKLVDTLVEGESTLDPSHIREGIVLKMEDGNRFKAWKHKSFEFKVLEGIIKEKEDIIDIEEAQDFVEK